MRRKTLPLLWFFLVFLQFSLIAQPKFKFNEGGYEAVLKEAKHTNKPVFFMLYASWCPHCHKMMDEVFPDPKISDFLNQNFIVAAQDVDQPAGKKLVKKYGATSYPTYVIVNTDGQLLYGFDGEKTKEEFSKEIQVAANPKTQLPSLEKEFSKDVGNGQKAIAYISALRKARQKTAEAAAKYFATQTEKQLISPLNWKIIANGISDISSREFQYVLKHQKDFAAVSSPSRLKMKIENIVTESLQPLVYRSDTVNYKKARLLVSDIGFHSTDSIAYNFDRQIYENINDWKSFRKVTITATEKYAWNNYQVLRTVAGIYEAKINDDDALLAAIKWSERSSQLQASRDSYLLTSRLYEKTNNLPKAIEAAQQARDFCVRVGFGTKEADERLAQLQSK